MTRRVSWRRTARVWRLTARNSARWSVHTVRRRFARGVQLQQLDDRFAIRTAEDVAHHLGNMKGAMMKFGQLAGFIVEAMPPEAQQAMASLQADAPPMAPEAAAEVVRGELGAAPHKIFLDWPAMPVAAASIGQVHHAVTRDGRDVAVKVQYPGVGAAIESDLANVDGLYRLVGAFALKGLDTKGLVNELRSRMIDELDYELEARSQTEFHDAYASHPFVRVPAVVPSASSRRVLTSEWVDGLSFAEFLDSATPAARRRAGESIWRFAQHSVLRLGAFNGDPHPGNYRFSIDGNVTFLDFGLVKRWSTGEWEQLSPTVEAVVVHRNPDRLVTAMEAVGFLSAGHGLDPQTVYDYVSLPYQPYLTDEFTFTRGFMTETLGTMIDLRGPHQPVIERLNMPSSFVILDRVVWGVNAILGKLGVSGPFRAMLLEYLCDGEPATDLGRAELAWRRTTTLHRASS